MRLELCDVQGHLQVLPNTVKSHYCLWFEDSSERALSKSFPLAGVFGQRLEETVLYERRYGVRLVPLVVEQCVTFIRERGLHEVGLFRQPGRASLVKELQEAFDSGERPSFDR